MRYFDKCENNTWNLIKDYYYIYGYEIDYNFDLGKNQIIIIIEAF